MCAGRHALSPQSTGTVVCTLHPAAKRTNPWPRHLQPFSSSPWPRWPQWPPRPGRNSRQRPRSPGSNATSCRPAASHSARRQALLRRWEGATSHTAGLGWPRLWERDGRHQPLVSTGKRPQWPHRPAGALRQSARRGRHGGPQHRQGRHRPRRRLHASFGAAAAAARHGFVIGRRAVVRAAALYGLPHLGADGGRE